MKTSEIMHKLLIEKEFNDFTVVELRDAAVAVGFYDDDLGESRKRIYRQILRFIKHNWLRSEGSGRKKRYFQTDLFKSSHAASHSKPTEFSTHSYPYYSVLHRERNQHKAELEIILGEIEEYQSINRRFPELENKLNPLLEQAKERSANLLGKVNVLTNVLNTLSEDATC